MKKNNELNVSVIEPVGGHGGMNYYDINLCEAVKKNSHINICLYTSDETLEKDKDFKIIKCFKEIYGSKSKYIRGINFIKGLLKALNLSKKNNASIIHFHFFHYTILELLAVLAAKFIKSKVIITAHDVESFSKGSKTSIAKIIYYLCDRVIAHNAVSKNELMLLGLNSDKVKVIPHGNYISSTNKDISKEIAMEKLNIQYPGDFIILFFGQIKKVKGLEVLINAISKVKDRAKIKVIVAGKVWKDDFEEYLRKIKKLNVENNFILHIKYIPDDMVDYYFNAADLVVLPYKKIYQSGVLLNSMSYGKAVLASDLPGMTEIITHNNNGFLFKTDDSSDLADKINYIIKKHTNIDNVSESAYNYVLKYHDWDEIGRTTSNLYRNVSDKEQFL